VRDMVDRTWRVAKNCGETACPIRDSHGRVTHETVDSSPATTRRYTVSQTRSPRGSGDFMVATGMFDLCPLGTAGSPS
jgi:hypothetical protein